MKDHGIVLVWDRPAIGRERAAIESIDNLVNYMRRLQEDGQIESFEPVSIMPGGGWVNGLLLIRGERERLDRVQASDEFSSMVTKSTLGLMHFGVLRCRIGEGFTRAMDLYRRAT